MYYLKIGMIFSILSFDKPAFFCPLISEIANKSTNAIIHHPPRYKKNKVPSLDVFVLQSLHNTLHGLNPKVLLQGLHFPSLFEF